MEAARGAEEHQLRQNQVKELKQRLEGMMLVLKVSDLIVLSTFCITLQESMNNFSEHFMVIFIALWLHLQIVHKVNTELVYARLDLQKALKEGKNSNISLARKRISWLEDRVVNLLGKCRQRVLIVQLSTLLLILYMLWNHGYHDFQSFNIDAKRLRGEAGEMPSECGGFDDNFSEICSMESPKQSSETSALTGR